MLWRLLPSRSRARSRYYHRAAEVTLQDLGNIGEFIGAIAVVISLVYLAAQIRQNTRALHSSSYSQAAEQLWLVNLAIAQDHDLVVCHYSAHVTPPVDSSS